MRGAGAPVVAALLCAYPHAAQLSKQGGLLALHLAARHGSNDAVLAVRVRIRVRVPRVWPEP